MRYIAQNDEVFYTDQQVVEVGPEQIRFLKAQAAVNRRRRARLCVHPDTADALHEMLIVHTGGGYVRPHKHLGKSESFHMVEGRMKVILFDDQGNHTQTVELGAPDTGRHFYYRLSAPMFHSIYAESETVVFHEVTNGPFNPAECIFAPWAPQEDAPEELLQEFYDRLNLNN